jgi:hypothetical protein
LPNLLFLATSCVVLETEAASLHRHYPASSVLPAPPSPHRARPVPHGLPVGLHARPPDGLSRVARSSSSMHAIATTPAEPLGALFARFPSGSSLPRKLAGSASALIFSRPAQRSFTLRPAWSPGPFQDPLHRRLQPPRSLCDCSDCYRLERKLPGGIRTHWKAAPLHGALTY